MEETNIICQACGETNPGDNATCAGCGASFRFVRMKRDHIATCAAWAKQNKLYFEALVQIKCLTEPHKQHYEDSGKDTSFVIPDIVRIHDLAARALTPTKI
jgi:hypothetical protein